LRNLARVRATGRPKYRDAMRLDDDRDRGHEPIGQCREDHWREDRFAAHLARERDHRARHLQRWNVEVEDQPIGTIGMGAFNLIRCALTPGATLRAGASFDVAIVSQRPTRRTT
jgi:hypothetical protein